MHISMEWQPLERKQINVSVPQQKRNFHNENRFRRRCLVFIVETNGILSSVGST